MRELQKTYTGAFFILLSMNGTQIYRTGGFFFFQAEDGIRYYRVTGVQTCALPILRRPPRLSCDWSSDVCSSDRLEEHTSELQSHDNLVCRLLLEKKNEQTKNYRTPRISLTPAATVSSHL